MRLTMEGKQPIIEVGEKVHVITRRYYKDDIRRHFAGEVLAVSDSAFRAAGYTFVFDPYKTDYRRLPSLRTRIFGFTDSGHITNVLPHSVVLDRLRYRSESGRVAITDDLEFTMEVNEFGAVS
jgi:hypothetical protein